MPEPAVRFAGTVGVQQRVLPSYRVPFFDRLAQACEGGLELFAGSPRPGESILRGQTPMVARLKVAENHHLLGGPVALLRQPGLSRWVEGLGPDVLVLEANPRYLSNWPAATRAARWGTQVVGWGLGAPGAVRPGAVLAKLVWGRFLDRFDGLIAYSSAGAAQYGAAGFPPDRITVAVNAVVDGPAAPVDRKAAVGRPVRLLFVGRLQERKRVDLLIEAAGELAEAVELRVVGDGPARGALESQAAEQKAAVAFVGAQEGPALSESFAWADLFVLPGTGGLAVQQAMAHGLAVIVAEGDGTQGDLVRPANGWQVANGSAAGLKAALRQAIADPEDLIRRGLTSRRIVKEEVNLDSMVRSFLTAFHLGRRRR